MAQPSILMSRELSPRSSLREGRCSHGPEAENRGVGVVDAPWGAVGGPEVPSTRLPCPLPHLSPHVESRGLATASQRGFRASVISGLRF